MRAKKRWLFFLIAMLFLLLAGCASDPKSENGDGDIVAVDPPVAGESLPSAAADPADGSAAEPGRTEADGLHDAQDQQSDKPPAQPEQKPRQALEPEPKPEPEPEPESEPRPEFMPEPEHDPQPDSQPAADKPEPAKNTIVFSVRGEGEVGVIIEETTVEFQDGDTVLDVLKRETRSRSIPMEYRGAGPFAYVEGIANIYEFDHGPESGWLMFVNGKDPGKSAGSLKLKPGDRVEWIYVMSKTSYDELQKEE